MRFPIVPESSVSYYSRVHSHLQPPRSQNRIESMKKLLTWIKPPNLHPFPTSPQPPPIRGPNNLSIVISHNHELMPPVPESLPDPAQQEVVYVVGIPLAVGMHDLAYDFVVEEGRVPYAGYGWEVGDGS